MTGKHDRSDEIGLRMQHKLHGFKRVALRRRRERDDHDVFVVPPRAEQLIINS